MGCLVTGAEDPLSALAAMREKRVDLGLRLEKQAAVWRPDLRGEERENEGNEDGEGQQHLLVLLVESNI